MNVLVPVVLASTLSWPVLWPELATNDSPSPPSPSPATSDRPTADLRKGLMAPVNSASEGKRQTKPRTIEVQVHAKVKPETSQIPETAKARTTPIAAHPAPGPDYEAREYPGSPTGWGWFLRASRDGVKPGRWEQQRRCNGTTCSLQWVWRED